MARVVVITGAARGIGAAAALLLDQHKHDFKVIATDVDDTALATLQARNSAICIRRMDIMDVAACEAVMRKVFKQHGRLDVLINNAGIAYSGPIETQPMEQIRAMFEVNLFGLMNATRAALGHMRRSVRNGCRAPHLINVSSVSGLLGYPFLDAYASTKFAVEGLTESLALYLPKLGVQVSLLEPGTVKSTSLLAGMPADDDAVVRQAGVQQGSAYARMLGAFYPKFRANLRADAAHSQTPEEVAEAIRAIVSSPEPQLRNIPHAGVRKLVSCKLRDLTGKQTLSALDGVFKKSMAVDLDALAASPENTRSRL